MRYHVATTFEEASRIASQGQGITRFLAGGTDVLVQLRAGLVLPDDLIDLKNIPGVRSINREADGSWRIGVAVSGAELGEHPGLKSAWPGVVEGMELVGSTQVQGRATLTGNLCNGSPAADSVPGLVAAGAQVEIVGPNGTRIIAVEEVPAGPGRTSLQPGELISAILLPARSPASGDAYQRFIPRTEMDIAVVGCAVHLRLDGDAIAEARVALGAVAPTVIRIAEAEQALIGTKLDEAALQALADAVRGQIKPISDKRGTAEFRTHVAGVLAQRVAQTAYKRAKGAEQ